MPQKQVYSTMVSLQLGDITKSTFEALVTDSNPKLEPGRGPNNVIHQAGGPGLASECKRSIEHDGPLGTAEIRVTDAGLLRVKYVIHAVPPKWAGGVGDEERVLSDTYQTAFRTAADYGLTTVVTSLLGISDYARFPVEKAARVGIFAVEEFCRTDERLKQIQFQMTDQFVYSSVVKAMTY